MSPIDWRELYASNRAVIEQAGGSPGVLPAALRAPAHPLRGPLSRHLGRSLSRRASGSASPPAGWEPWSSTIAGRTRRAWVHPPAGVDSGTPVPLVCMLHGCTQDPAGFAAATRCNEAADRHGFAVVYPEQPRSENAQACWNWFEPGHQGRAAGEPASIATVVRELVGTTSPWSIDADRIFVAGLSAGGAMAAILGATYPDLFAAIAVHSGLAFGAAGGVPGAFAAMARGGSVSGRAVHTAMGRFARPLPTMVVHGTADRVVAPVNGSQVLEQFMEADGLAAPGGDRYELARPSSREQGHAAAGGHAFTHSRWTDPGGTVRHELLSVEGMGHAWSGGTAGGSHTDPRGPDATEAMVAFFAAVTADRTRARIVHAV